MSQDYDNIYAKILDGKSPCYKIFETDHTIAILENFPFTPGHSILISKAKGYLDSTQMIPVDQVNFMNDLPRLVKLVQKGSGMYDVNIMLNIGENSGQTVLHPHIHVVPRKEQDKVIRFPKPFDGKIKDELADLLLKKMSE